MTPLYRIKHVPDTRGGPVACDWQVIADVDVQNPADPLGPPLDRAGTVVWRSQTKIGAEGMANALHRDACAKNGVPA